MNMIAVPSSYKRKRNRAVRERALVLAAGKLFSSRGYDAATTREIAALAGCAEGLIHRYFDGKAGLLLALIKLRMSRAIVDLHEKLPSAATAEEEIVQLVNWEVERMWTDREFLKVVIPQALLDPSFGQVLNRIGPQYRGRAIGERLKKFKECQTLPEPELEALTNFVSVIGFMFGFMRPAVLRQDREDARRMATAIAKFLGRSFQSTEVSRSRPAFPLKSVLLFFLDDLLSCMILSAPARTKQ